MFAPETREPRSIGRRPASAFNEAGACLPRKLVRDWRRRPGPGAPSMRPGHVCPGNEAARALDRMNTKAFNEAGACLPRKQEPRDGVLRPDQASMRPGHVCPGNLLHAAEVAADDLASMRPGHVCPGNGAVSRLCRSDGGVLQ